MPKRWAGARPIVGATLAVAQKMGRCKTYCRGNPCSCPKIKRKITEDETKIVGATLTVAQKMGRCKTCPYLSEDEMNPRGCPKIKRKITEDEIKIVGATLTVAQK